MVADLQLAAMADPTRRTVFALVAERSRAVGEIAALLPVTRPAVSQHLKVLAEAGLVAASAEGTRRIYRANPDGLSELRRWIDHQWDRVLDEFEDAARKEHALLSTEQLEPVMKRRRLPVAPDSAFALFTERIADWWPVATHSIHGDDVTEIRFEGKVGGRVVEVTGDGTIESWADVLAWDPPHRLVLSWHPNPNPVAASTLEVRFAPTPEGGTELTLEHRGWEEFGTDGAELRESYDGGWEIVLAPYETAASTAD